MSRLACIHARDIRPMVTVCVTMITSPPPPLFSLAQSFRAISSALEDKLSLLISTWSPLWNAYRQAKRAVARVRQGGDSSAAIESAGGTTRLGAATAATTTCAAWGVNRASSHSESLRGMARDVLFAVLDAGIDLEVRGEQ